MRSNSHAWLLPHRLQIGMAAVSHTAEAHAGFSPESGVTNRLYSAKAFSFSLSLCLSRLLKVLKDKNQAKLSSVARYPFKLKRTFFFSVIGSNHRIGL